MGQGCSVTAISLKADEIVSGGSNGVANHVEHVPPLLFFGSLKDTPGSHTPAIQWCTPLRVVSGSADGGVRVFGASQMARVSSRYEVTRREIWISTVRLLIWCSRCQLTGRCADGTGTVLGRRQESRTQYRLSWSRRNRKRSREALLARRLQTIIKWNKDQGLRRNCHIGMRLVVRKGMLRM